MINKLGAYGLHLPWIKKTNDLDDLSLILESPNRKNALACFLKIGVEPNLTILSEAFENGKLDIVEYCLSKLNINNVKLQEIMNNSKVIRWANLKDWKYLVEHYNKRITIYDLRQAINDERTTILPI